MLSAILVAAGQSKRLGSSLPKPLVKIAGEPAILYSLRALDSHPEVDEIIAVVSPLIFKQVERLARRFKKVKCLVLGGARRQDSVFNGLKSVDLKSRWVLVHDSARPFIRKEDISRVILAAKKTGAAVLAVKPKATIKLAGRGGLVKTTLDRDSLAEIQTPQVFKKELLLEAYKRFFSHSVTDDAALVEKAGVKVLIAAGSYENIKITTPEDLLFAGLLAKRLKHGL